MRHVLWQLYSRLDLWAASFNYEIRNLARIIFLPD